MSSETILTGQVLGFTRSPFEGDPAGSARLDEAVLIRDGHVVRTGAAAHLRAAAPQARVEDIGEAVITAGFVDAHAHYPQTAMIASWGKRLIDWLNAYTFPEEMRFADP
ncbi:MAG: guanine deaminase, partial [Roseovarius indicus]